MSDAAPENGQDKADAVFDKIINSKALMARLQQKLEEAGYDTFRNVMRHEFPFPQGEAVGRFIVLDSETTDLDPAKGDIIQLSMYSVEHDGTRPVNPGNVRFYSSYNDPGYELSAETTEITGITTKDVKGKKFNGAEISKFLSDAGLVVAHNAAFDRKWVEKHLPNAGFQDKPWACSLEDVSWNTFGFASGGKNMTVLAMTHGYTFPAHNAESDTRALVFLLGVEKEGVTPLSQMLERIKGFSFQVVAFNSPFRNKDLMSKKPYFRFNGDEDQFNVGGKAWVADLTPESSVVVADTLRKVYGKEKIFEVKPSSALVRFSNRSMRSLLEAFDTSDPEGSAQKVFEKFQDIKPAPAMQVQGSLLPEDSEQAINF